MRRAEIDAKVAFNKRAKIRRDASRLIGNCTKCHIRVAAPGMRTCPKCQELNKQLLRKHRAIAKKNRMCQCCRARPARDELKSCAVCGNGHARRKRAAESWCDECLCWGEHRSECRVWRMAA